MSFCVNKSSSIFLSLFQFVNANFVSEEMVWQTAPVSDDSKTLKLKIVYFCDPKSENEAILSTFQLQMIQFFTFSCAYIAFFSTFLCFEGMLRILSVYCKWTFDM